MQKACVFKAFQNMKENKVRIFFLITKFIERFTDEGITSWEVVICLSMKGINFKECLLKVKFVKVYVKSYKKISNITLDFS